MLSVLMVDDHILFREGMISLLNGQPDVTVVGQAASVHETIEMARTLKPELILMNFGLPDGTGLDATPAILADNPGTKIVFLTVHEEDDQLIAAIRSGAEGYLLKNVPLSKLLTILRGVERGEPTLSSAVTNRISDEFAFLPPTAGPAESPDKLTP